MTIADVDPIPASLFELLGLSAEAWDAKQRRGAISARGYHFQDAVLSWLGVLGVTNRWPVAAVVPEAGDDGRLLVEGASVDVQVKSRQPHLSAVSQSELSGWVATLAQRHRATDGSAGHEPAARLLLVVEQGVPETGFDRVAADVADLRTTLEAGLDERMPEDDLAGLLERLHVVTIRDPLSAAARALAEKRKLNPAVAQHAVQRLTAVMAGCQDHNAQPGRTPAGLTLTECTGILERAIEQIDLGSLEAALQAGLCESVDFSEADHDERYLLGVATTPAHVAAGLVVDRPLPVSDVIAGLDDMRRVLVAGPSGIGKSAVAWLTVHATRHLVRWYRIRDLRHSSAVATIDRFARSLAPSEGSPVGFVVDDVGRQGAAAWDALVEEFSQRNGVLLLGTVRELDLYDVHTVPSVQVLRPVLDEGLAEELWTALRAQGATPWEGWREPFEAADGLVLEYTALLTAGERLEAVIEGQIRALAHGGDDDLLALLALVAVADLSAPHCPSLRPQQRAGLNWRACVPGSVGYATSSWFEWRDQRFAVSTSFARQLRHVSRTTSTFATSQTLLPSCSALSTSYTSPSRSAARAGSRVPTRSRGLHSTA